MAVGSARRSTVIVAIVAVLGASLAACASNGPSKAAGSTATRLTVNTPDYGALVRGPVVPVSVRATGSPDSVRASVNEGPMAPLSSSGGTWTGNLRTAAGFTAGANTVTLRALGSGSRVLAKEVRQVYVLGSPADLGLTAADATTGDTHAVKVTLGQKVAQVSTVLNGREITPPLSSRPGTQTLTLGAGEGLHPGSNAVEVTAVKNDGAYQDVKLTLTVPDGAPIAGAGSDAVGRTGVPVRLTGTAVASGSGTDVSYHWDVVRAPANAHPTLQSADKPHPSLVGDVRGDYVLRVRVSQPGRPSTSDEVTVTLGDAASRPLGAHLDTQLASVNGIALDGKVVTDGDGHQTTVPAGQQGGVLALFDRQSLEVISVDVVEPSGWSSLVTDLNNATSAHQYGGVIAVLSSPSGIGGPAPNTTWEPLLQALGVDNPNDQPSWDKNVQSG
ncbi:MAG: hypothetical protein JO148_13090, partial [Acidimicrobiia bacterium]|nr:hypothetical protein [Acidimicrobiia bacterium]